MWGEWGEWSMCDVCQGCKKQRNRTCLAAETIGYVCKEDATGEEKCEPEECSGGFVIHNDAAMVSNFVVCIRRCVH